MRSAEKQPEVIRFVTGIDQSGGTRGAQPGTFDLVKNMRFQSGGLQKRCGSTAIASSVSGTTLPRAVADTAGTARPTEKAAFIGRAGDQKVAGTSAGDAFVYGGTVWQFQGCFSAAQPVRRRLGLSPSIPTRPAGPYMPGCAVTSGGYVCTAAGHGSEVKLAIESPAGELVYTDSIYVGGTGAIVRVVAVGSAFYVLYQGSALTAVNVRTLTVSGGAVTSAGPATMVTLTNAASTWDVSGYDGTNWFIVYQSAATTVTLGKVTGTTVSASATFASTNNATYLSVWADSVTARVWVGLVDDPGSGTSVTAYRVYTAAPALSVGPTTLVSAAETGPPLFGPKYTRTPAAGDAFFCYARNSGATAPMVLVTGIVTGGTVTQSGNQSFNVVPISKPDIQQRVWCMTYAAGTNFTLARAVLLRFEDALIAGPVGGPPPIVELASPLMETPGATYHPQAQPGRAFHAVGVTTESAGGSAFFAFPFVLTTRTNASGGTEPTTRVDVYEYTRHNQEPHRQMVRAGLTGFVSGQPTELWGSPSLLDGDVMATGAVEIGYAQIPTILTATVTPDAGGLAAGSYVYFVVEEWVDDEGNRHLSSPSAPLTATLTVPSSVALSIAGTFVGQRPNAARDDDTGGSDIHASTPTKLLYRTQDGGTEAQLVPIATTEAGAIWSGAVTFTDTVADSIIDDNEFIYTAGGVLANLLAPSCRYLAVSEERLWCGGLWDSNIVECSKVKIPGEPFTFTGHPSHQVVIPGEVTGLAYQDGQVCVFCEDAVYIVSGDGPNDQGAGGFAPPRALVRGVGCPREQSASILETEAGILFRSAMGFYVIPRGFSTPQYIGDKVQDENPLVLSAATTTTSENRLARFLIAAAGGVRSNKVQVLDLTNMQWVRDEYTVDGAVITGQGFSEIGEWPDGLALMSYGLDRADNPNVVWAEDEDETGDAGAAGVSATTYISQYARTNWLKPGGDLAECRCTRAVLSCEPIGSSSVVTMAIETDGNASEDNDWTVTTSESVAYRDIAPSQARCTEVRVTISDAAGASNSAGVRLLALGFETQVVGGMRRLTDSEGG